MVPTVLFKFFFAAAAITPVISLPLSTSDGKPPTPPPSRSSTIDKQSPSSEHMLLGDPQALRNVQDHINSKWLHDSAPHQGHEHSTPASPSERQHLGDHPTEHPSHEDPNSHKAHQAQEPVPGRSSGKRKRSSDDHLEDHRHGEDLKREADDLERQRMKRVTLGDWPTYDQYPEDVRNGLLRTEHRDHLPRPLGPK